MSWKPLSPEVPQDYPKSSHYFCSPRTATEPTLFNSTADLPLNDIFEPGISEVIGQSNPEPSGERPMAFAHIPPLYYLPHRRITTSSERDHGHQIAVTGRSMPLITSSDFNIVNPSNPETFISFTRLPFAPFANFTHYIDMAQLKPVGNQHNHAEEERYESIEHGSEKSKDSPKHQIDSMSTNSSTSCYTHAYTHLDPIIPTCQDLGPYRQCQHPDHNPFTSPVGICMFCAESSLKALAAHETSVLRQAGMPLCRACFLQRRNELLRRVRAGCRREEWEWLLRREFCLCLGKLRSAWLCLADREQAIGEIAMEAQRVRRVLADKGMVDKCADCGVHEPARWTGERCAWKCLGCCDVVYVGDKFWERVDSDEVKGNLKRRAEGK